MLGIYLKDVVEDEQGQEQDEKLNVGHDFEPKRIRRQIQAPEIRSFIENIKRDTNDRVAGNGEGTTKRSFAGFDVRITGFKKDNDAFDNFVNFDVAPKQINPRFEAIANSRHNLSLIQAKGKVFANSIIVNNSPTKIEFK